MTVNNRDYCIIEEFETDESEREERLYEQILFYLRLSLQRSD